MLICPVNR